jgi:hypothetical protein
MLKFVLSIVLMLFTAVAAAAASADQERAFVAAYQKAFDSKDAAAIEALLYTDGADPMILQFYGGMLTSEMADGKLVSITLDSLTPEDVAKGRRSAGWSGWQGETGAESVQEARPENRDQNTGHDIEQHQRGFRRRCERQDPHFGADRGEIAIRLVGASNLLPTANRSINSLISTSYERAPFERSSTGSSKSSNGTVRMTTFSAFTTAYHCDWALAFGTSGSAVGSSRRKSERTRTPSIE